MEPRAQRKPQQEAQQPREQPPPDTVDGFLRGIAARLRAGERPESAPLREGAHVEEYPITYEEDELGLGPYALVHWVPPDDWHGALEMETWGGMQGFRFNLYDDE